MRANEEDLTTSEMNFIDSTGSQNNCQFRRSIVAQSKRLSEFREAACMHASILKPTSWKSAKPTISASGKYR